MSNQRIVTHKNQEWLVASEVSLDVWVGNRTFLLPHLAESGVKQVIKIHLQNSETLYTAFEYSNGTLAGLI